MKMVSRCVAAISREQLLWGIVALAFLLRVAGIGYGLPLAVVSDEPPFTLAALQMLQLHTLVPSLHAEQFATVLYYPPYLSYILLIPFTVIIGVQFIFWQGTSALFQAHLLSDLSAFFITARLVSVLMGTFSVYLVYRIAERMFRSRIAAAAAAFLLATSILHQALSMVGRHWMPTSCVFLLVLFVLTRDTWSMNRRYMWAFGIAGIGMGFSALSVLALVPAALYYFLFDAVSVKKVLHDAPHMIGGAVLFLALTAVSWLLYHSGHTFLGDVTLSQQKTLAGVFSSPWSALSLVTFSEPILVALFLGGMILLLERQRKVSVLIAGSFLVYVVVFYLFFRFEPRFTLPLIPLYALAGGYGVGRLWGRRSAAALCALLCIPLVGALRLSYVALLSDTRTHAREWATEHLKPSDRVLVFSSAMHVPTQAAAVAELRSIDPNAMRKIDEADEALDRHDVPYALNNLTSLIETPFMNHLPAYARAHGYTYLILEPRSLIMAGTTTNQVFMSLTRNASVTTQFEGFGTADVSIADSSFAGSFIDLFAPRLLGPDIVIYQLH